MIAPFDIGRLPRIAFGEGTRSRLPELAAGYGRRMLLVTGEHSLRASVHGRALHLRVDIAVGAVVDGVHRGGHGAEGEEGQQRGTEHASFEQLSGGEQGRDHEEVLRPLLRAHGAHEGTQDSHRRESRGHPAGTVLV